VELYLVSPVLRVTTFPATAIQLYLFNLIYLQVLLFDTLTFCHKKTYIFVVMYYFTFHFFVSIKSCMFIMNLQIVCSIVLSAIDSFL